MMILGLAAAALLLILILRLTACKGTGKADNVGTGSSPKGRIFDGSYGVTGEAVAFQPAIDAPADNGNAAGTESVSISGALGMAGSAVFDVSDGTAAEENSSSLSHEEERMLRLKAEKPDIDINSWEYILANDFHSIEDYEPPWTEEFRGVYLDYRIIGPMSEFVSDAESQGLTVCMISGYRSYYTQSYLFEEKAAEYDGDEDIAETIVARPGTSEHQTGLAADIADEYYSIMNSRLSFTELYQWMSRHCHEYGFIVRFPEGKEEITGIIFEPWHYRYVGVEAATFIMENNLTLEEFVELYR